jgi:D-alanyl-D-alanine carboxypeptidase (penicillin-binding protein 5/6)
MKGSLKLKKKILKKAKPLSKKTKNLPRVDISVLILIVFVSNLILIVGIVYVFYLISATKIKKIPTASTLNQTVPFVSDGFADISAQAFVVYDPSSRIIIAEKNAHLRFAPASTAKIMTALISLEEYQPNTVLKAGDMSVVGGSSMKLFTGEEMTVKNLLYGMMLPSGNDAAVVLAQNYSGGQTAFVSRMNQKAEELKLANTHFLDPAGYEDENYTTAFDLVRLSASAFQNPLFRQIVRTRSVVVYDVSGNFPHKLESLNELLSIPGVVGVKTGFTNEAGGVLVTAIEKGDRVYFVAVLRSNDRFADTKSVMNSIIEKINLLKF